MPGGTTNECAEISRTTDDERLTPDEVVGGENGGLSPRTVNNHVTILRRCLAVACEWKLIDQVPKIQWLRVPGPEFDFLDFEEAERLVAAADYEWPAMIFVAIRTGLRRGERVFCHETGRAWRENELRRPLYRACRRAGIRRIGWHVLWHVFASHLVMRALRSRPSRSSSDIPPSR